MGADTAWMAFAACRPGQGVDPETFFPQHHTVAPGQPHRKRASRNPPSSRPAKNICRGCPVTAMCLAYALTEHLRIGVFGGMSENERYELASENRAHGTARCYYRGCRCDACIAANALAEQLRIDRRSGLIPCPPDQHGRENSWQVYRCRCDPCKAAHEETLQRHRKRPHGAAQ